MKIRNILFIIIALPLLTACESWLDVQPRTEIKENDIYLNETGFKEVMNGIYIQMASEELYGMNTTMYFNDNLARIWTVSTAAPLPTTAQVANYNFTHKDVEPIIGKIWNKYYSTVSDINNLIDKLNTTDVKFGYGNRELLLGEAHGLRAFLHLDLLRLFGPVPSTATDGDITIPYVTELTKNPDKLKSVSYGEVKQQILRDLDLAADYLKDDPFLDATVMQTTRIYPAGYQIDDEWQYYRPTHFNIYAVTALRARFYQWIGDTGKAVQYAKEVLEFKDPDEVTQKFMLANESNSWSPSRGRNLVMRVEHLFGLHCSNHQTMIEPYLFSSSPKLDMQNIAAVNTLFQATENPSDVRNVTGRYWRSNANSRMEFLKYAGSGQATSPNIIPLLRVAEMYLILIENLPIDEAKPYFETFRISRNMSATISLEESTRLTRVEHEYRKDFYGEGQLFFFFKRHNRSSITVPATFRIPADGLVIPKPDSQKAFE